MQNVLSLPTRAAPETAIPTVLEVHRTLSKNLFVAHDSMTGKEVFLWVFFFAPKRFEG